MPDWSVVHGDVRERLAEMPAESVQTVVTSPPYWGLRDYGLEPSVWGGEPGCAHEWGEDAIRRSSGGLNSTTIGSGQGQATSAGSLFTASQGAFCSLCPAWRGNLGLEPTPALYVEHMVTVFRAVRRVLREDGCVWLVLGDSYANDGKWGGSSGGKHVMNGQTGGEGYRLKRATGLKSKDLVGIPWRVAFALQADGWVLRSEIIWSKPNPMPESITDRPTKAHEQVFLFSKAKWSGAAPCTFNHISDSDARWLALLFDTEGNIVVKRSTQESGRTTYGLQVAFANTHQGLMEQARNIVQAGSIHQRPGRNAPMYYWQLANIQAAELMKRVYPFLIVKQRQAQLGIFVQSLFATSRTERLTLPGRLRGRRRSDEHTDMLERCWATMKLLNHFGNPDLGWVPKTAFGRWDSQPYYYDAEAIKEPQVVGAEDLAQRVGRNGKYEGQDAAGRDLTRQTWNPAGRNRRTVWTIATEPWPLAHFATFPTALVEPCIKAGTSERGQCPACGAPWTRVVERTRFHPVALTPKMADKIASGIHGNGVGTHEPGWRKQPQPETNTLGWRQTCSCPPAESEPQLVLDPFAGSGTVGVVALRLGRRFMGIELNAAYVEMARNRILADAPLLNRMPS